MRRIKHKKDFDFCEQEADEVFGLECLSVAHRNRISPSLEVTLSESVEEASVYQRQR